MWTGIGLGSVGSERGDSSTWGAGTMDCAKGEGGSEEWYPRERYLLVGNNVNELSGKRGADEDIRRGKNILRYDKEVGWTRRKGKETDNKTGRQKLSGELS